MVKQSAYGEVIDALTSLCKDEPDYGIFVMYYPAKSIAEKAGISESTARKHLSYLAGCYGYSRRRIRGTYGYRKDPIQY